jgi:hypothetical protein
MLKHISEYLPPHLAAGYREYLKRQKRAGDSSTKANDRPIIARKPIANIDNHAGRYLPSELLKHV